MPADQIDDIRPAFELRGRNYLVTGGAQVVYYTIPSKLLSI